jgi:hypothetical protein
MIYSENRFRPVPTYPVYPPYHVGKYIEDYCFARFAGEDSKVKRDYIGISWTTLQVEGRSDGVQGYLNKLPSGSYFTICQHDDGVAFQLPQDTLVFSSSQYTPRSDIPIPAICSPVPCCERVEHDIFASFVGSYTHPIRGQMCNTLLEDKKYFLHMDKWSPQIASAKMDFHLETTCRSKFTLCPRGYGNTSFRMYEAMQLGSVPVYISDDFCLPWADEINWEDLAILVKERDIGHINKTLEYVSDNRYQYMLRYIDSIYNKYFSLDGVYNNILKRLK